MRSIVKLDQIMGSLVCSKNFCHIFSDKMMQCVCSRNGQRMYQSKATNDQGRRHSMAKQYRANRSKMTRPGSSLYEQVG